MELFRKHGKGSRSRNVLTLAAVTTAAALLLTGCTQPAADGDTDGASSEGASITFIPKNLNNPYTGVELKGGEEASGELGFTYNAVGSLDAAADSQIPFIQTEVQNGTQIIALAANDPNAVCSALNEARDGGAKVITFDSDADVACRDMFITQVEEEEVALGQLRQLFDQIGGEGEIAILSATADASIAAAARYLSTSEYKGQVALVGLGLPPQMKEYVKDGTVTAFALWDPSDIGYLTAYAGKALLDGTITGAEGDTFDAGKLGSYTVGADGRVVVGSLLEFNADNIDDYDYISF